MRVAFEVLDAWGFAYKNLLTWAKGVAGTGTWLQGQTEHCLLAARGKPVLLPGETTLLSAPRGPHSQKPGSFYAMVERACPAPPESRLELFARRKRDGWDQHGTFELEDERAA
jgi:N6-adenosine-specific RNA methylase IME4